MAAASGARRTTTRVRSKKIAPRAAAGSPQGSRSAPAKKSKPGALVQRVYNTIDSELEKLEKQKGLTSQD
ncbi:MAG: hypothetical protein J0H37_00815, partial [Hyphomicrobium denitrificans]|nr:hypothetical protein [Hyphomicrobium denitrificans]